MQDSQALLETAETERDASEREAEDIRCQMEEDNDRQLQDLHDKCAPRSTSAAAPLSLPLHFLNTYVASASVCRRLCVFAAP